MPDAILGRYLQFYIDAEDLYKSCVSSGERRQNGCINVDIGHATDEQVKKIINALEGGMDENSMLPLIVAWVAGKSEQVDLTFSQAAAQLELSESYVMSMLDSIAVGEKRSRSTDSYLTQLLSKVESKAA